MIFSIIKRMIATFVATAIGDVGSGDINGNNKFLFDDCHYEGNDIMDAKNVTIVSRTKDLPFEDESFDTIISTECFEHDPEYKESWLKIYKMLKPNGLFVFTCAAPPRGEHGTRRSWPMHNYGCVAQIADMQDYYKNLTHKDLNEVLELNKTFSVWNTYYETTSYDLYFVGIKKSDNNTISSLPIYNNHTINTSNDI
jgi:SAM-dependent methyltransferase